MILKHRFLQTAFKNGFPQFEAGKEYDPTEQTRVYVATGVAKEVQVEEARVDAPARAAADGKKGKKGKS